MWERGRIKIENHKLIDIPLETSLIFSEQGGETITYGDCNKLKSIRSISKAIVSLIVLKLYDEGIIDLNCNLAPYLVKFGVRISNLTIHDLLNQRIKVQEALFSYDVSSVTANETILNIFYHGFEITTDFHYTNSSYFLLGVLLEEMLGKGFLRKSIIEKIFLPLGINNYDFKLTKDCYTYGSSGIKICNNDLMKIASAIFNKDIINAEHIKTILNTPFLAKSSNRMELHLLNKRKYSFGFWRCGGNIFYGDGKDGQLCIIDFDNKTLITALSDLSEGYNTNVLLKEIEKLYEECLQ